MNSKSECFILFIYFQQYPAYYTKNEYEYNGVGMDLVFENTNTLCYMILYYSLQGNDAVLGSNRTTTR